MKKILIVGPAWLGDMVMAQSLLILLKQQGAIIDVLATDWTFAVLERMPEVRRAISLPIEHGKIELGKRYQIGKSLREESYDQAIVLPNSFKSAIVPAFAHIPQRTGWLGEMRWGLLNDVRVLNKEEYPLMVQRFVALGYDRNQAWDKNHYPQPV
jgi:heptosyltransferase-2